MHTTLHTYLTQQGYQLSTNQPAHHKNHSIDNNSDYLTVLSQTGLIQASGEDRNSFLQNLTSNDVQQINEHTTRLNSLCSPKGRVLSVFRQFQYHDNHYLSMPTSLLDPIHKRLKMYILRSKVKLEMINDALHTIALGGNTSPSKIRALTGNCPEQADTTICTRNLCIIRVPGEHPRFEIYGPAADLIDCWQQLITTTPPAHESRWLLENIRAGLPMIYPTTIETFVGQMLNLDLINAINFKKGCYPGQEIIARTHYRGKTKRRMLHIRFNSETPPAPSTPLYDGAHSAGELVDAQPDGQGQYEALAVIQLDHLHNPLKLGSDQGPPIQILQLPYTVEEAEEEAPAKN